MKNKSIKLVNFEHSYLNNDLVGIDQERVMFLPIKLPESPFRLDIFQFGSTVANYFLESDNQISKQTTTEMIREKVSLIKDSNLRLMLRKSLDVDRYPMYLIDSLLVEKWLTENGKYPFPLPEMLKSKFKR